MANTYTQLYIHIIFVVKWRKNLINPSWKDDLHKYIASIVQDHGHKMIVINSMPDHVHMAIGYNPEHSLSDLMKRVKAHSTKWLKQQGLVEPSFAWQLGYGAFSFSRNNLGRVIKYIEHQDIHHTSERLVDEYKSILKLAKVEYDERYIFTEPQ